MERLRRFFSPRQNTFARFIYAALLVFGTYNPSGVSVGHWLWNQTATFLLIWPQYTLTVLVLAGLWLIFLRAARQALSLWGLALVVLIVGITGYLPFHLGWLAGGFQLVAWVALSALAAVLGFGASFATWWWKLFGQRSVDIVNDEIVEIQHH